MSQTNLDVLEVEILGELVFEVVADLGQVLDGGGFSVVGHFEIGLKIKYKIVN